MNYTDINGEEPNKAQATTIDVIVSDVREFQENSKSNGEVLLDRLYHYFNKYDSGPRYVYTEKKGWIDFKHFFAAAFFTLNKDIGGTGVGGFLTRLAGLKIELEQLTGESDSAFSYEDLPSNSAGIQFAYLIEELENQGITDYSLSDLLKVYFEILESTEPEDAPNYDHLPDDYNSDVEGEDDSNGKNYDSQKDSEKKNNKK